MKTKTWKYYTMRNLIQYFVATLCLVSCSAFAKTVYFNNQSTFDIEIKYQVCNVSAFGSYHCAGTNVISVKLGAKNTTPINVDSTPGQYKGIFIKEAKTLGADYQSQYSGQACVLPTYRQGGNNILFFSHEDVKGSKTGKINCTQES